MTQSPLLEITELGKRFGGLVALEQISFRVNKNDVLGIVGPNGAGKSTLFNLISGHLAPEYGQIYFEGDSITARSAEERAKLGIARTFQKTKLFYGLTVEENVQLGCFLSERGGMKRLLLGSSKAERADLHERVDRILERTGLQEYRRYLASQLSYGYQRRLEFAIALGSMPKLLLLDEPFGGLSPESSEDIGMLIRSLNSEGMTIIFIDHRMESIISYCNRLFVMRDGNLILPASTKENSHAPG